MNFEEAKTKQHPARGAVLLVLESSGLERPGSVEAIGATKVFKQVVGFWSGVRAWDRDCFHFDVHLIGREEITPCI